MDIHAQARRVEENQVLLHVEISRQPTNHDQKLMSRNRLIYICLFLLWTSTNCKHISSQQDKKITIAIQPLGKVNQQMVSAISSAIESIYSVSIILRQEKPVYPRAFVQYKTPRFRADSILKFLKSDLPDGADYILGVTEKDISTTKYESFPYKIKQPESKYKDWGIFGLGMCPGNSSVVSSFRTRQCSKEQLHLRMQKIAVHELGHNFGLRHCPDKNCVMTDAVESIRTVDNAALSLCQRCYNKL